MTQQSKPCISTGVLFKHQAAFPCLGLEMTHIIPNHCPLAGTNHKPCLPVRMLGNVGEQHGNLCRTPLSLPHWSLWVSRKEHTKEGVFMGPLPALLSYRRQLRGSCEVLTQFHTTGRMRWEGHLAEYLTQILPPPPPSMVMVIISPWSCDFHKTAHPKYRCSPETVENTFMTSSGNKAKNMCANNPFQSFCEMVINVSTSIFILFYILLRFRGARYHDLIFTLGRRSLASGRFCCDRNRLQTTKDPP